MELGVGVQNIENPAKKFLLKNVIITMEIKVVQLEATEMMAKEIDERISAWLKKNAKKTANGFVCSRCGDELWGQGKRLSEHEFFSLMKSHTGGGHVQEVVFPYCKKCDMNIDHFSDITCIDG